MDDGGSNPLPRETVLDSAFYSLMQFSFGGGRPGEENDYNQKRLNTKSELYLG